MPRFNAGNLETRDKIHAFNVECDQFFFNFNEMVKDFGAAQLSIPCILL